MEDEDKVKTLIEKLDSIGLEYDYDGLMDITEEDCVEGFQSTTDGPAVHIEWSIIQKLQELAKQKRQELAKQKLQELAEQNFRNWHNPK